MNSQDNVPLRTTVWIGAVGVRGATTGTFCIPRCEFVFLFHIFHDFLEGFFLFDIHAIAFFFLVCPIVHHFDNRRASMQLQFTTSMSMSIVLRQ